MQVPYRFPFGKSLVGCKPKITCARPIFILGAYPSALHVAWQPPESYHPIAAMAVDNEPDIFWDGANEPELVAAWKKAVEFRPSWGEITGAGHLNGSSGRWINENVLPILQASRRDVWLSDCLDLYHCSHDPAARISDTFAPWARENGMAVPVLPQHPDENAIVKEALAGHRDRLLNELTLAEPQVVVTLGNAALRVLMQLIAGNAEDLPKKLFADETTYGGRHRVQLLTGAVVEWLPLAHPGSPMSYKQTHKFWMTNNC